ncbi:MAG: hypothetical protein HFH14_03755 [Lachnospiraceae bacterium]|nr:hypothetical protein [Lachnospiraceae bacterium]
MVIYFEVAICFLSILMKMIQSSYCKRLIRDSSDMSNARTKLVCGIKKEFEKEYRRMKYINNTNMFVSKHMYGIRIMGLKVSSWEVLSVFNVLACAAAGGITAYLAYENGYDEQYIIMNVLYGFIAGFLIVLSDLIANVQNKIEHLHVNMCEYLENEYKPMLENSIEDSNEEDAGERVRSSATPAMPGIADEIDDGIRELFRLMNESDSSDISADSVSSEISLSVDEERILKDVLEEYLT